MPDRATAVAPPRPKAPRQAAPAPRSVRPLRSDAPPARRTARVGEVEFLPPWYPRLRRLRRRLAVQALLSAAVVAGLALRFAHTRQRIGREEASLAELVRQRERHRQEDAVLAKLGRHVEPSRLMAAIDAAAPPGVALAELNIESDPGPLDFFSPAYLAALRPPPGEGGRRVRVHLRATAPSAVEAANFVAALSKQPSFRDVTMTDARGRFADDGTSGASEVSEFRVAFWLDLVNAGEGR